MSPEEKLACRLVARHNLTPPYNLKELVSLYAEVESLNFPFDADGISIGLKQRNKPKIYINSLRPDVRQKFTLAHELGHVVLPWHIGNIVSHTEIKDSEEPIFEPQSTSANSFEYRQIEAEANRFAAELLMPRCWLSKFIETVDLQNFDDTLKEVMSLCGTSRSTTLIKFFDVLPPGYACAEINSDNIVINSFISSGTQVYGLSRDTYCAEDVYPIYKESLSFNLGNRSYVAWTFERSIELPEEPDNTPWRTILKSILKDTDLHDKKPSINAILPSLFQSIRGGEDTEVFSAIVHRYSGRKDLEGFVRHPLFEQYIVKRLKELRRKYPR